MSERLPLWVLCRPERMEGSLPPYGQATCFIVQAATEGAARAFAAEEAHEEGPDVWLNPVASSCTQLYVGNGSGVLYHRWLDPKRP